MTAPVPVAGGFLTAEETRAHLNLPDASNDAELAGFIAAACQLVEKLVGPCRPVTKKWMCQGESLILPVRPILSVERIVSVYGEVPLEYCYVDLELGTIDVYTLSGDWRTALLYGASYTWGQVEVQYTAGRTELPAAIRLGALELCRHLWQFGQQGLRPRFGGAQDEASYATVGFAIPNRVKELLAPYMLPSVAM